MRRFDEKELSQITRRYILFCVVIITLLACVGIGVDIYTGHDLSSALGISVTYNLIISFIYIIIWRLVVKVSRDSSMQVYLAGSGLRLITAMFVCLIYAVEVESKPERIIFAAVFCTFYMMILIADTCFFVKLERKE